MKNGKRIKTFLWLLVYGIIVGVTEDLIAIFFATDARITWQVVEIVILVAIPFAFLGEIWFNRSFKKK